MKDKTSHKENDKPKSKQKKLGHDHLDYRELWGSTTSAFDGLVAGHSPSWMDAKASGFSDGLQNTEVGQLTHTQMVTMWQLGSDGPVCGILPVSGIADGGCNVGSMSFKFKIGEHHSGDAPLERGEKPTVVIPTDGGCF